MFDTAKSYKVKSSIQEESVSKPLKQEYGFFSGTYKCEVKSAYKCLLQEESQRKV